MSGILSNGLSLLDLVKHALRTIIEGLNEDDRLGVVIFSDQAQIVQEMIPMRLENKMITWGTDVLRDCSSRASSSRPKCSVRALSSTTFPSSSGALISTKKLDTRKLHVQERFHILNAAQGAGRDMSVTAGENKRRGCK